MSRASEGGSVLRAVEAMRGLHKSLELSNILVFLYVCENEGLSVSELAQVTGYSKGTASRALRALLERDAPQSLPPGLGLVAFEGNPLDRRGKSIWLTERGVRLRSQIDESILADAAPT